MTGMHWFAIFGLASAILAFASAYVAMLCVKPGTQLLDVGLNPLNVVHHREYLTPCGLWLRRLHIAACVGIVASIVAPAVLRLVSDSIK